MALLSRGARGFCISDTGVRSAAALVPVAGLRERALRAAAFTARRTFCARPRALVNLLRALLRALDRFTGERRVRARRATAVRAAAFAKRVRFLPAARALRATRCDVLPARFADFFFGFFFPAIPQSLALAGPAPPPALLTRSR